MTSPKSFCLSACTKLQKIVTKIAIAFIVYLIAPLASIFVSIPVILIYAMSRSTVKLFNPDLKYPISLEYALFATDDFWGSPKHTIVTTFHVDKPIDKDTVLKQLEAIIIDDGKFPELQYRLKRWLGIFYWSECSQFSLTNHISVCPNISSKHDLERHFEEQLKKPFTKDQPLWEILLYPNYSHEHQYACVFRIHHVVTDAMGFRSFFNELSGIKNPSDTQRTSWSDLFSYSPLIHYKLTNSVLKDINWNSWTDKSKIVTAESVAVNMHIQPIPLSLIKMAGEKVGAKVSEVLYAALATGLMKHGPQPLPETISGILALPRPGHPGTFTNYSYLTSLAIPLTESDPLIRLRWIQEEYKFKTKTAIMFLIPSKLSGILIQLTGWKSQGLPICSFAISNYSLSRKPWTVFGAEIIDLTNAVDVGYHMPLVVVFSGYKDNIKLMLRGRDDIFQNTQLQEIDTEVMSYIEMLGNNKLS